MDIKLLYNPGDRKFRSVGEKMLEWEPCPNRGWASKASIEQPRRTGKKCCCSQKSWGWICCSSVQSPTHLSQIIPFVTLSNTFNVYFSKELCPLVLIVLNMFLHASVYEYVTFVSLDTLSKGKLRRCRWCSRYRRSKWTRRHEFKSWTRLIAFHIALIPLGKVWIQLFSLQLWVNSRTD